MRPFLFLSGEFAVTMPVVFQRNLWTHTMSARKLILNEEGLHRQNIVEDIKGVIYYCRTEDYSLECHNLEIIRKSGIPCYPPVDILIRMSDRHAVLQECCDAGFVSHPVQFSCDNFIEVPFPCVLKVGQGHCGTGKHLLRDKSDITQMQPFQNTVTIEPFFEGCSVRILIIGNRTFGIRVNNSDSWIANTAGAEIEPFDPCSSLIKHAQAVRKHFGLDIAGVDYILTPNSWHFLEINQYPGLDAYDDSIEHAKRYLDDCMSKCESAANY
jgi:glutathione synthase/RimK-type ligase-like ATP-grasp enzyme